MLQIGDKVKDFKLLDNNGKLINISDHLGSKVVVYIYPKNNTPGCTRQACSFRDYYGEILEKGVILYGISTDSVDSHKKFKEKYNLPFPLLSDPNSEIIDYFGAYQKKNVFGRKIFGTVRSTYIIDEKGYIEKIWMPAIASQNPKEVLEYLNQ